jgi:F-type H+-transporting ATPase subunit a
MKGFLAALLLLLGCTRLFASGESNGEFNPGEMIMHHIGDSHDFHVYGDFHLPLPIILYSPSAGLSTFMSSEFGHGHETHEVNGYSLNHGKITRSDNQTFFDLSITKNVFTIILASIVLMIIFLTIASKYKKHGVLSAPKGVQSFFEPIVLFIRDEVAVPYLGKKASKYLPYLLTIFFFIWIVNLMGLIPFFPGSSNVTGNISVTLVLAFVTFFITQFSGNKYYWSHILLPDVPWWLYPIVVPVEILGIFTKPFALMVRLFANITAGHIIILSLVSLVFIFGKSGESMTGGLTGGLVATLFGLFMNFMELLVAVIQAFIFTTLSAVFIGSAVEEHHH